MRPAATALRACVLHRYDWSESSLILDVFTRERGRLAVAAKGAKRPYSQLRGVLLPFHPLTLTLGRQPVDDSAEIFNLRQAEWAGGGSVVKGSALFAGFYLNELVMKMLPRQDPHPRLYDAYEATLRALDGPEAAVRGALRAFELTLLREAGYLPDLSTVTLTRQPVVPTSRYRLVPESGVIALGDAGSSAQTDASASVSGELLLGVSAALEAADRVALVHACGDAHAGLRAALKNLLHYHLGPSELKSRQVFAGVKRLSEPGGGLHSPS